MECYLVWSLVTTLRTRVTAYLAKRCKSFAVYEMECQSFVKFMLRGFLHAFLFCNLKINLIPKTSLFLRSFERDMVNQNAENMGTVHPK